MLEESMESIRQTFVQSGFSSGETVWFFMTLWGSDVVFQVGIRCGFSIGDPKWAFTVCHYFKVAIRSGFM